MGVPAETRSILGHLFNISMPYSYENPVFELVCGGVEELNEEFDPDTDPIQYICENTKTTVVSGYDVSFSVDVQYIKSSKMQNFINDLVRRMPVGRDCAFDYIRFNKAETIFGQQNQFIGIRRRATICPNSIGGSAGDPLSCTLDIHGSGSGEVGVVTVTTVSGHTMFSWIPATTSVPYISTIGGKTMSEYFEGIEVDPVSDTSNDDPLVKVEFTGIGIPGATVSHTIKSSATTPATATVSATKEFTIQVDVSKIDQDSSGNYSVAFTQSVGEAPSIVGSVTTSPFVFKVSS